LGTPNERELPFNELVRKEPSNESGWKVSLENYNQQNNDELAKYLNLSAENPGKGKVAFLDLAESTAGDDWGFITRVISLLPSREKEHPHHLLVIDAIEGLEMLTGDTDAFGQTRSRRSRIAQILRAAAGKCHVVLILEEDTAHEHPAEEYVVDIVIRLRVTKEENYYRRSLEVVKARGQTHIRGEHDYVIRQGKKEDGRSKPGVADVMADGGDQPATKKEDRGQAFPDDPQIKNSYVHVMRSLHSLSRILMYEDQGKKPHQMPALEKEAGKQPAVELALMATPRFGAILPSRMVQGCYDDKDNRHQHTYSGLHRGRVTSLIGDEATLKSRLGRAFLAGAFAPQLTSREGQTHQFPVERRPEELEAAVLITTFNTTHVDLKARLKCHWNKLVGENEGKRNFKKEQLAWEKAMQNMDALLICRQLEVHHLNASHLFHIIRRSVEHALIELEGLQNEGQASEKNRGWSDFSARAKNVRVVIDDWALIQSTHPEIAADKLFLPFLIKYFQRVGVTALIISTQPGRPEEILRGTPDQPLRALTDYRLYTWHVPFYGTERVALTALPPMERGLVTVVGELRNPAGEEVSGDEGLYLGQSERLWVDSHFELYKGVENNDPQPVPLEVHLFSGADGFAEFGPQLSGILNRLFTPQSGGQVLVSEDHSHYAELRDFLTFHGNMHSDHAVVIQVDEYWKPNERRDATDKSRDERATMYLRQKTFDRVNKTKAAPVYDPFSLYQPPVSRRADRNEYKKYDFFNPDGYGDRWWEKAGGIPYQWDFGFLLLKKNIWQEVLSMPHVSSEQKTLIFTVYENLKVYEHPQERTRSRETVTWHQFFKACVQVASFHSHSGSEDISAFDLDTRGPQSFACLVLEIWASEIQVTFPKLLAQAFPRERHGDGKDAGLFEILGRNKKSETQMKYRFALFRTWMLLAEVLNPKSFTTDITRLVARPAPHTSVAERQWYSTGSLAWRQIGANNPVIPARLPGCGTIRGDWFLMVAKDSRSQRLSERAIDLLCRRRRNQDRMELGLGLPMRRLNDMAWDPKIETAKAYQELLTAMATYEPDGRRRFVRYGELLGLGSDGKKFQWLWRSRLKGYQNDDRIWEKWLGRILVEAGKHTSILRTKHHLAPFRVYEGVDKYFSEKRGSHKKTTYLDGKCLIDTSDPACDLDKDVIKAINVAWEKFNIRCDSLVSELK
ncbi:MAG TPA: ATPase domain-containing protein, partial [Verrucomicrobiae bacterium]|nr:ATPase domain-containing protein [Verrucomicrobiae bacterium]